jgi:hypothetical protein
VLVLKYQPIQKILPTFLIANMNGDELGLKGSLTRCVLKTG